MIWVAVREGVKFGVGGMAVVNGGVELKSCGGCGDGDGAAPMGADGQMGRRGGTVRGASHRAVETVVAGKV